jgi:hypothetical protein
MTAPTAAQSAFWDRWRSKIERRVVPKAKALVLLAEVCNDMQNEIGQLTGTKPVIVSQADADIVNEIGRRAKILNTLITKVLLKTYAVRFANGDMDIVSLSEEVDGGDYYPKDQISMSYGDLGIAPIIVAAGIVAITLLIAGDQAGDRLEKQAEIERLKLQQAALKADQDMATKPKEVRDQWTAWKKQTAAANEAALKANPTARGWIEKVLGSKGTMALVVGALAIGALMAFGPPKLGRRD